MAKNWKKLLPTKPDSTSEIDLKKSLQDLLQLDDTLKSLLKERKDLEQQIKALSGESIATNEPASKTFDQPIVSFQTKRKRDKKQFETKRQLEEKIAAKKLAFKHWQNQRNKLKLKVLKAKKLVERTKTFKDDFLKDDFEARWQEKRNTFKDRILKKPKDIWSEKRDKQKKSVFSKIKEPIRKKVTEKIEQKTKVKKVKDQWELLRDKNREAKKLKAKGDKKWNDIQKKSMVDAFDVLPKEAKNELKQFEDDFKRSAQKEKDDFEEKQLKLKAKLKAKASKAKNSQTSKKKKEQEEVNQKKRLEEKREEDRQKRQTQLQENQKKERNREQKREQRREERKNRKKEKYA
jgi:hypothetical protein